VNRKRQIINLLPDNHLALDSFRGMFDWNGRPVHVLGSRLAADSELKAEWGLVADISKAPCLLTCRSHLISVCTRRFGNSLRLARANGLNVYEIGAHADG
jgi:hypothetical protein